jgi:hypothetical protein
MFPFMIDCSFQLGNVKTNKIVAQKNFKFLGVRQLAAALQIECNTRRLELFKGCFIV